MNDEEDFITITLRCRVKGRSYQKTYLPENPSNLLPVLKQEGWRFAQKGKRSLPVCPRHYPLVKIIDTSLKYHQEFVCLGPRYSPAASAALHSASRDFPLPIVPFWNDR
jgi:hypothetical protein